MVPGPVGIQAGSDAGSDVLTEVRVDAVPARLFLESQDQQQDLIREFVLIELGDRFELTAEVPQRLARLIADILADYADVRWATRQQALQALENGREELSMAVPVRPGMGAALRRWLDLLEQADRFCEEGALLTLAATPEVRRLRHWYVEELLRLLPAAPAGTPSPT